jgi:hypothetical protein
VLSQNIYRTLFSPGGLRTDPQQQASMSNLRLKILSAVIAERLGEKRADYTAGTAG